MIQVSRRSIKIVISFLRKSKNNAKLYFNDIKRKIAPDTAPLRYYEITGEKSE
jgi:hypothetical protein